MSRITPTELIALKAGIKEEMSRRNGIGPASGYFDISYSTTKPFGSASAYAGSQYDFVHTPAYGDVVHKEFGEKTIEILRNVTGYDKAPVTKQGEPVPAAFNGELLTYVENLKKEPFTGLISEQSSCKAACTGLCAGSCIGLCNCCNNCAGGCGGGCSANCGTGCMGNSMKYSNG